MSVTWTKNGDNKYLVESKEHLLQIMNQGALYTDMGDHPTDYWESDYLQTVDIDLANDHANIVPIGIFSNAFGGEYDGGRFQISNVSHSGTGNYVGLFGNVQQAVIKHIRLSGVWTMSGGSSSTGFLAGYAYSTTVIDVEGNFEAGTVVSGSGTHVGGLFGDVSSHSNIHAITLRGTLEFQADAASYVGGVFGSIAFATMDLCRNLATIPGGINGGDVGGICGKASSNFSLSKCLNAMQGDLTGSSVGGICGDFKYGRYDYDSLVNSMVGNISSSGNAGGIFGVMDVRDDRLYSCTKLLNYMKGDVVGSTGSGGIVGSMSQVNTSGDVSRIGNYQITKSIVAMQGNVEQAVRGTESFTPNQIEVTVDATFHMVYTFYDHGSATMVVDSALVYDSSFTDLPYIDMSGTDTEGNVYNWDFVFANIGGKAAYDDYTHLSVHKSQVSAPFYTDYGLTDSNSVVYLTYANLEKNSVYIDSNLTVIDTAAAFVFDKATLAFSVAWTKNHDGKYLVHSKQHLLQIMNQGSSYTNAGDTPTDYWASSYVQTSDIDLVDDHANIVPIGHNNTYFTGEYDGGLFAIKNWSYTGTSAYTGLFGYCEGVTLKHIRLSGVWTSTAGTSAGLLCGYLVNSTANDLKGDFAAGTLLDSSSFSRTGGLIGNVDGGSLSRLSVRGTIDIQGVSIFGGGVIGYIGNGASVEYCRNLATFPSGIEAYEVGGIVGYLWDSTISKCSNAMIGDIIATSTDPEMPDPSAGGICGRTQGTVTIDLVVNGMTGSITSQARSGGILGYVRSNGDTVSFSRLFNYMTGDLSGSSDNSGGLVGNLYAMGPGSITKSIVAMSGTVEQSVRGSETIDTEAPPVIEVNVDKSFGMTSTGTDHESATMVVDDAFVYDPGFTDLPYFVLSGTDADGNTYPWDFVYGNVGGKYPDYTHLSVHTAQVSAPFYTDFGLGANNDAVYLTYANIDTNTVHHNASLTVVETVAANFLPLPSEKDDFLFGNVYDITEAGAEVSAAVNDLFVTGDAVAVNVFGNSTKTTFVNRGGEVGVAGVNALLLPFDPAVADAQDATLTLSDATSVSVGFDQASGDISVNGTMYSAGDYFIMDGKKVTVVDV